MQDPVLDENFHDNDPLIRSKIINQLEWSIFIFEGLYLSYVFISSIIYYPHLAIHPFIIITTIPCIYAAIWRYWSIRFDAYKAPILRNNKLIEALCIAVFVLGFASSPFLIGIIYMVYANKTQAAMKSISKG